MRRGERLEGHGAPVSVPVADSHLLSHIRFSGLAQIIPLITTFIVTPYLITVLGLDVFGVWSLVLVLLATLTALDGGVAASLGRFYAIHMARGDKAGTARMFVGSLLLFLVLGAMLTGLGWLAAPTVVHIADVPQRHEGEATAVLRLLAILVTLALLSNSAVALLHAGSRFKALAALTATSSACYLAGVILLVGGARSLMVLLGIAALRYAVLFVGGVALALPRMAFERPLVPTLTVWREFWRYALRMQASGLTSIAGSQLDALVIAALMPVRYVGLYTAGYQAASALHSLPLYGFPPILTRMTTVFAERGIEGARKEFHRLQARWFPAVLGYGAVATSAIGIGVLVWLGREFVLSGVVATVLMAGYGMQSAMTGMRTCFVRSIGKPGLETRYSVAGALMNLFLTIPLALLFGVVGVVTATAIGLAGGSLYFQRICRRAADLRNPRLPVQWWLATLVAVGVTVAGELLVLQTGLHGPLAFVLAGVPGLLGLIVIGADLMRRGPVV